ncbi:MAG: GGDEF domain-containing protein [Roseateles depolymerans]|uniref:GGDEF domain-containing protein n=1 Tax=Roseateles depolymerans TaxID=76731 RepID=A0A2W5FZP3_9BURK|nr:MAG: GGDEF domain-containing protein [Roseateles depolymerans]
MDRLIQRQSQTQSLRAIAGWIVLGNLLLASVLVVAALFDLDSSRVAHTDKARETADNLAHSLSIELAAEFKLVDNALTTVAQRYRRIEGRPEAEAELKQVLLEQERLIPFVRAVRVTDARGRVVLGLPEGMDSYSIAGRDYFLEASQASQTVVSEPLFSRVFNDWCVIVARRLDGADGRLHGVIYAVMSQDHFKQQFSRLAIGDQGAISLRSDSMRLVARYSASDPAGSAGLGAQDVSAALREHIADNAQAGWYVAPTAVDKVERLTTYRRLPGYPFTVLTGVSSQTYLAAWRADAQRLWAFTALLLGLIAFGSVFLYRQHRRQYKVAAYARRLAVEQNLLLDNDMVGMVRVRDRRVIWANRAVGRLLGRGEETLIGESTRVVYLDDEAFDEVGRLAYAALQGDGRFRTQIQMRTADGRDLWVDLSGAAVNESESVWMMVDVDKLKRSEALAQHLALHDPLTGLANRRLFEEHLSLGLAHAQRTGHGLALCYMDLDGFKPINDSHGHEAGDEVLKEVGSRLRRELRANDSVARLGGDEFAWLLTGVNDEARALALLERCEEVIQRPIPLSSGAVVQVACSIGLAFSGRHGSSSEDLLAAADDAMYRAKRSGRGHVRVAGGLEPVDPARAA